MGIVNFGIPEIEARWIRKRMNLTTFIEGGTYQGGTAKKLSKEFKKIITIEKSDVMYEEARKNISSIQNVIQLRGDTRDHLPKLASENNDVLFWLDAHWSGGATYGENDECPLLQELYIIFNSPIRNFAILIDDARLFLAPPPLPHKVENWPTIKQVADIIPSSFDMTVYEDVIYLVPNSIGIPQYFQDKTTANWRKHPDTSGPSMKNRIINKILSIAATLQVK